VIALPHDLLHPRWAAVIFWTTRSPHHQSSPACAVDCLEIGGPADLVLAVARATGRTATEVEERLLRGARCLIARVGDDIASVCWLSRSPEWLQEINCVFRPPEGDLYIWDCLTRPSFRGRHLYPTLLAAAADRWRRDGGRGLWIATRWDNWRSARGITRARFRPVGMVIGARWLLVRRWWILGAPGAPAHLVRTLKQAIQPGPMRRSSRPDQLVSGLQSARR